MRILRRFGPRGRYYERPQDDWVCGHLADGCPCRQGPDARGNCRAGPVCQPERKQDRWECRRSHQEGGPCENGPLPDGSCCLAQEPCVPKASLRKQRRRATAWLSALTVGLLAIILTGGVANEYLMPGRLASQHANLTDCQSCHANVKPRKLGWLHGLAENAGGAKESAALCTACHDVGPQLFSPHTAPVAQLAEMTRLRMANVEDGEGRLWVNRLKFAFPNASKSGGSSEIFCATCHQEHKGSFGNLTEVSNDRCQTCHAGKFGRFEASHPAFVNYPFARRTPIIFDHQSHFGKHFPDVGARPGESANVPEMCETCHVPDGNGRYMSERSFDDMCAGCHSGDILGQTLASGPKGTNFLSVPGLDVETLRERGIDIGAWPDFSEADITPFMRSLLASVLDGRDIAAEVSGLDLLDLRDADAADLEKVETLAWAVKRLLLDIERDGLPAAMGAGAPARENMAEHRQMALMVGVMSHDVISAANREWLPDLEQDLDRHDAGMATRSFEELQAQQEDNSTRVPEDPPQDDAAALAADGVDGDGLILDGEASETGGLILDEGSPAEETGADALLNAPAGETDPSEGADILAGDDSLAEGDILGDDDSGEPSDMDALLSAPAGVSDGDDGGGLLVEEDSPAGDDTGGGLILAEDEPAGLEDLLGEGASGESGQETSATLGEQQEEQRFDPEDWAVFGGWYRQDYTIRYRPTGHEDPFLKTWLDYSSRASTPQEETLRLPVFEALSDPGAVGRCMKCHSVDTDGKARSVRWQPFDPASVDSRFTRFSHDPHISAVGEKGCASCHALSTGADTFLKSYEQGNPEIHSPNFSPLDKATCSGCHTEKAAGEECTLCHQYHTQGISLPLVQTELPK